MAQSKMGNFIKIVGLLTFVGTILAKVLPLFQKEHPKLKKKIGHIGELLNELKDEIVDLASSTEVKGKKTK